MSNLEYLINTISSYCVSSEEDDFSHELYDLFLKLKVPENLRGISAVTNQLENCFGILPDNFFDVTGLRKEQLTLIGSLINTPGSVLKINEVNDDFTNLTVAKNWMSDRSVYSLLLTCENFDVSTEINIKQHYKMLVSAFIHHYLTLFEVDNSEANLKGIMEACRGLRLSLNGSFLDKLKCWENIEGFLKVAKQYRINLVKGTREDNYLREIIHFFDGTRGTHATGESHIEIYGKKRLEQASQLTGINDGEVEISTFISESNANTDGLLHEDHFNDMPYAHVKSNISKKEPSVNPASIANKKRNKAQSITLTSRVVKANNKSLMSPSVLQLHQLYHLFSALLSVTNDDKKTQLKVPKKLVVLIVFLSIYLNKSIKELKEMTIGQTISGNGVLQIDETLFFSFVIKAKVKTKNENREERCVLPIPKYWCAYILSFHSENIENESQLIPAKYSDDIDRAASAFIKNINSGNDIALSLGSISNLFTERYQIKTSADLTAINFAFDNDSHYTRVKSFYTLFENSHELSKVINSMWDELEQDIKNFKSSFSFPPEFYSIKGSEFSKPIGSVFCPELHLKEVCSFVNSLKEPLDIKDNFTIRSDIKNLVEYHNRYVLYVSQMLLCSTGYRAIYDPLPSLGNINFRHSLITITDKDYHDRISTRVIPLADVFVEQVKLYLSHIEALIPHLTIYEPSIFERIYFVSSPALAPCLTELSKHGPLFKLRLKANGELVSDVIKPEWLKSEGNIEQYSMFANSGRHLLESYLTKNLKNQELIYWFSGHANYGASPFELKSSFNINDAKKIIAPHLNSLMEACQWKEIRSKIA